MELDYTKDIEIDPDNLESMWIEQGSLFLKYGTAHADAVEAKDNAKVALEYEYSQIYTEAKSNWEKYFDSKPTEAALKEYIAGHSTYRKKEKYFIKAVHNVNVMLTAKNAFEHRKKALENLVSLKISGFYSEPKKKTVEIVQGKKRRGRNSHKSQVRKLNRRRK